LKTNVFITFKVYLPTDAQYSCFKTILKFTLKQLHVSVQSASSGSVLFELAKVIVIKIISSNMQPHHRTNHDDVF